MTDRQPIILIVDDDSEFGARIQEYLQNCLETEAVEQVGNGAEAVRSWACIQPDLVILDLIIPGLDGLGVLEQMRRPQAAKPGIIVITDFWQDNLAARLQALGVDYVLLKPFALDTLGREAKALLGRERTFWPRVIGGTEPYLLPNLQARGAFCSVRQILQQVGVPERVNGFGYLLESITLAVENPPILDYVTKELYPAVAGRFGTTPARVERGIRHAVEVAWKKGNREVLQRIFGGNLNVRHDKPTNSEFIATVAERLRFGQELASK